MRDAGILDDEIGPEIERIALALRQPVDLGVEVDHAVMRTIRAAPLMAAPASGRAVAPRPARRGGWQWLVRPRSLRVSVSPLGAMAAAAVALIAALIGLRGGNATRGETPADRYAATDEFPVVKGTDTMREAPTRTTDTVYVTKFVLVARDARHVSLVGDFNDWDHGRTPLRRVANGDGLWTVDVPLPAGTHKYSFLVDGTEWVADPNAARAADDDFGQPSSVVTVEARRS